MPYSTDNPTAQQIFRAELLIGLLLKVGWATIVLVIGGVFANPQSAQLKR